MARTISKYISIAIAAVILAAITAVVSIQHFSDGPVEPLAPNYLTHDCTFHNLKLLSFECPHHPPEIPDFIRQVDLLV